MKLMYITNNPQMVRIVCKAGVDFVFVDMESIGKEQRQGGLDTVKNHHTIEDIVLVRKELDGLSENKTELLVRINPIHSNTKSEIDKTIGAGADVIMLPMWKTVEEVQEFLSTVNGRAKCMLLLENKEAVQIIDQVLELKGIDYIHIGLNDMHLSYKYKFMFEPLANGIVDDLISKIKTKDILYGFGGIARLGTGTLPAEKILLEHSRLGSNMVILSRSFCDLSKTTDLSGIEEDFCKAVLEIREKEELFKGVEEKMLNENHKEVVEIIRSIVEKKEV